MQRCGQANGRASRNDPSAHVSRLGRVLAWGAAFSLLASGLLSVDVQGAGRSDASHPKSVSKARQRRAEPALPAKDLRPVYVGGRGGIWYRNMVVVLTWHAVAPKGVYDTISQAAFAGELATLKSDHMHPIQPSQLAGFLAKRSTVPPNAVLLTFDNGTESVYQEAMPLLKQYHDPILLFPIFGRTNVDPGFLTSSQIAAMVKTGLVTLGSHTFQEHNGMAAGPGESLPADIARKWYGGSKYETVAQYEKRVLTDADKAQAAIRHYMGRPEPYFSDPFGQYTPLLIHILAKAGFTEDFTTLGWAIVPGAPADRLPRINVGTGSSDSASMMGAVLTVAQDTAKDPAWHPPVSHTIVWHY